MSERKRGTGQKSEKRLQTKPDSGQRIAVEVTANALAVSCFKITGQAFQHHDVRTYYSFLPRQAREIFETTWLKCDHLSVTPN